jgi:hypothetical protein
MVAFREVVRLNLGPIRQIIAMPDFGWLLVIYAGTLAAFNLNEMIPTSEPETWKMMGQSQTVKLSSPEHNVSFARVGDTKERLMGGLKPPFLTGLTRRLADIQSYTLHTCATRTKPY